MKFYKLSLQLWNGKIFTSSTFRLNFKLQHKVNKVKEFFFRLLTRRAHYPMTGCIHIIDMAHCNRHGIHVYFNNRFVQYHTKRWCVDTSNTRLKHVVESSSLFLHRWRDFWRDMFEKAYQYTLKNWRNIGTGWICKISASYIGFIFISPSPPIAPVLIAMAENLVRWYNSVNNK